MTFNNFPVKLSRKEYFELERTPTFYPFGEDEGLKVIDYNLLNWEKKYRFAYKTGIWVITKVPNGDIFDWDWQKVVLKHV